MQVQGTIHVHGSVLICDSFTINFHLLEAICQHTEGSLNSVQKYLWILGRLIISCFQSDVGGCSNLGCKWSPVSELGGALNHGFHLELNYHSLLVCNSQYIGAAKNTQMCQCPFQKSIMWHLLDFLFPASQLVGNVMYISGTSVIIHPRCLNG